MRSPWDARRSLQRYVKETLGKEWEVALEVDRGRVKSERFVRVVPATDATVTGQPRYAEIVQTYSVDCYPEQKDSVVEAEQAAYVVVDQLERAFSYGVGRGRPLRVPLYDFDGVANDETSYVRDDRDFLQVVSFAVRTRPDPEEARNIAVIADVRVRWRRSGRLPFDSVEQLVENVATRFNSGG